MDINKVGVGDILYVNHHVVEPELVSSEADPESTDFVERSAKVKVEEVRKKEGSVIVIEPASDRSHRWLIKVGQLLQGPGSGPAKE